MKDITLVRIACEGLKRGIVINIFYIARSDGKLGLNCCLCNDDAHIGCIWLLQRYGLALMMVLDEAFSEKVLHLRNTYGKTIH